MLHTGVYTKINSMQEIILLSLQEPIREYFTSQMAERGGFEPPIPYGIHPFQGCALSHYATSPYRMDGPIL